MSAVHLEDLLIDDTSDLLGEEDDFCEDPELGIDYLQSDRDLESTPGGKGKPRKVVLNPTVKNKVIRKLIVSVSYDKDNSILVVDFSDGCRLTVRP